LNAQPQQRNKCTCHGAHAIIKGTQLQMAKQIQKKIVKVGVVEMVGLGTSTLKGTS